MNSTTSFSPTIWDRRSLVSDMGLPDLVAYRSVGNRGDQLQGVQLAAHPPAERLVDHLVLLDPVLAGERGRGNAGQVMVAVVDERLDLNPGVGQRRLDQRLDLGGRHRHGVRTRSS